MYYAPQYSPAGFMGLKPGNFSPSANTAVGQIGQTLLGQPAQFANVHGGMFGSYGQNLQQGMTNAYGSLANAASNTYGAMAGAAGNAYGSMADASGNAYGAYTQGLANLANAQANERGNMYGAYGMAEAARQGALGNIGSAALGAYGSASNAGMAAWAQNQMAYNQAAAEMAAANQQGLANLGASRNAALGQVGTAYGEAGGRLGAASAVGDLSATFGGDFGGMGGSSGFSATGPGGEIASGDYGGSGGGGGGFYGSIQRTSDASSVPGIARDTFGGLAGTRDDIMRNDITNAMLGESAAGRRQLDSQHYSSRGMPSAMVDQALSGLLQLGQQGYRESSAGMDQFYSTPRATNFSPYADAMTQGYRQTSQNLLGGYGSVRDSLLGGYDRAMGTSERGYGDVSSGLQQNLNSAYEDATGNVSGLYNQSLAPLFTQIQQQAELDQEMRNRQARRTKRSFKPQFGENWIYGP